MPSLRGAVIAVPKLAESDEQIPSLRLTAILRTNLRNDVKIIRKRICAMHQLLDKLASGDRCDVEYAEDPAMVSDLHASLEEMARTLDAFEARNPRGDSKDDPVRHCPEDVQYTIRLYADGWCGGDAGKAVSLYEAHSSAARLLTPEQRRDHVERAWYAHDHLNLAALKQVAAELGDGV